MLKVKSDDETSNQTPKETIDGILKLIGPYDSDQNERSLLILPCIGVTIGEENRRLYNMRNGDHEETIQWKDNDGQLALHRFTDYEPH